MTCLLTLTQPRSSSSLCLLPLSLSRIQQHTPSFLSTVTASFHSSFVVSCQSLRLHASPDKSKTPFRLRVCAPVGFLRGPALFLRVAWRQKERKKKGDSEQWSWLRSGYCSCCVCVCVCMCASQSSCGVCVTTLWWWQLRSNWEVQRSVPSWCPCHFVVLFPSLNFPEHPARGAAWVRLDSSLGVAVEGQPLSLGCTRHSGQSCTWECQDPKVNFGHIWILTLTEEVPEIADFYTKHERTCMQSWQVVKLAQQMYYSTEVLKLSMQTLMNVALVFRSDFVIAVINRSSTKSFFFSKGIH